MPWRNVWKRRKEKGRNEAMVFLSIKRFKWPLRDDNYAASGNLLAPMSIATCFHVHFMLLNLKMHWTNKQSGIVADSFFRNTLSVSKVSPEQQSTVASLSVADSIARPSLARALQIQYECNLSAKVFLTCFNFHSNPLRGNAITSCIPGHSAAFLFIQRIVKMSRKTLTSRPPSMLLNLKLNSKWPCSRLCAIFLLDIRSAPLFSLPNGSATESYYQARERCEQHFVYIASD